MPTLVRRSLVLGPQGSLGPAPIRSRQSLAAKRQTRLGNMSEAYELDAEADVKPKDSIGVCFGSVSPRIPAYDVAAQNDFRSQDRARRTTACILSEPIAGERRS